MTLTERLVALARKRGRTRMSTTMIITVLVTLAVVVPLAIIAANTEPVPTAGTSAAVVYRSANIQDLDTNEAGYFFTADVEALGPAVELDQATLSNLVFISVQRRGLQGASFNLFAAGSTRALHSANDLQGPTFDLFGDGTNAFALDTTTLDNGTYELSLFIKQTTQQTSEQLSALQ